jgi:hypothetical protein
MRENFLRKALPYLVIVFCIAYIFFSQKNPCNSPITYKIGTFDKQFGISEQDFLKDVNQGAEIWNKATGKEVLVNRPISVIFKFAVPEMRASSIELKNLKIKSFDLTKIFDDRKDEVYLDAVHVSDVGNEIIASSIFELIKDSLKK